MLLYINGNYFNHSLHSELVNKLAELGNEITVYVPMRGTERADLYPCDHPRVKIISNDCLNCLDRVFFISKIKKIVKTIEQQVDISKVDCILAGTVYSDGAVAYMLHKKYRVPFSVAVRETDVTYHMKYRPYLNGYIRKMLNSTTSVIFLAPSYKRIFEKFGIEKEKCKEIPNAVNDYWFQQTIRDRVLHDPLSLIYVGDISKRKNVCTTIRVVKQLNNKGIKTVFHIVGTGSEERTCQHLAQKTNMEGNVFFHGWQDGKNEIKKFYDFADIFVMPSYRETFGTVYVEALSQGLPLIYTKGQGIDGYFEKGSVGFGCNPNDVEEIVEEIINIRDNYNSISKRCIKEAERFKWDRVAYQYHDVICNMRKK